MSLDGLEPVVREPGASLPGSGESQVWAFSLDLEPPVLAALQPLLSSDEMSRADRLRDPRDRSRFIAGRAQLRQVLGDCLGRPPGALQFIPSPEGKPSLEGDSGAPPLHFSVAGSEALGLLAVRTDAEIGVDVERVRPMADLPALARRMLGADEHREYEMIPKARREARFFEYWVRKEAVAKALGTGLREGLHRLRIHPWPLEAPHPLECLAEDGRATTWVIGIPVPVAGYVAALAATRPIGPVLTAWWEPRAPD